MSTHASLRSNPGPLVARFLGLAAALALVAGAAPPAVADEVVVDGDLSDLVAVAQGDGIDPCNELLPLCRIGYDFERVLVYYDWRIDTLYLGIDVMDVEEGGVCLGLPGPGVPGDLDGDGNPNDIGYLPECPVGIDDFGVGLQEIYLLRVDTNADFDFTDPEDVRVVYTANQLRFETGTGAPLEGVDGTIVLGVAGAPFDPMIPNQNRQTEDIEVSVDAWSSLCDDPYSFHVEAFAGALLNGLPEDVLQDPIQVSIDPPDCRPGSVNAGVGSLEDVLLLNGSAGAPVTREVTVHAGSLIWGAMFPPPAGGDGRYVVHADLGEPDLDAPTVLQRNVGLACFPFFLTRGATPEAVWNNLGFPIKVGSSRYFDGSPIPNPAAAPSIFLFLYGGDPVHLPVGTAVTFQGILVDPGSASSLGASATNAVILRVL
jgi:hypothetical protein